MSETPERVAVSDRVLGQITIAAAIVVVAAALTLCWALSGRSPTPVCIEREAPMAERVFAVCVTALAGNDRYAAQTCRQQAEELSCKSWGAR